MSKRSILACALVLLAGTPAWGYKIEIADNTNLNIDLLLQAQVQAIQRGAPDGERWGKEFLIRRVRLLLFGEVIRNVSFFFETDMPNWGKGGDWSGSTFFVQDAYMSFRIVDALHVDAGMIIVPFTRHGMQSGVSLQGLDYHGDLIRYPTGSHKVWRDFGVQLRGYLLGRKLQYRAGVFNGSQDVSLMQEPDATGKLVDVKDGSGKLAAASAPRDYPRLTAHLRYNLLGEETEFFFRGILFAREPVLSVGLGVDFQPDASLRRAAVLEDGPTGRVVTTPAELDKYLGLAGDAFLDLPLPNDMELVFQIALLRYWNGTTAPASGTGVLSEFGLRWRSLQPVVGFDFFRSDRNGTAAADLINLHYGVNWWIKTHVTNLKLEAVTSRRGDLGSAPWNTTVFLQGQIFI